MQEREEKERCEREGREGKEEEERKLVLKMRAVGEEQTRREEEEEAMAMTQKKKKKQDFECVRANGLFLVEDLKADNVLWIKSGTLPPFQV